MMSINKKHRTLLKGDFPLKGELNLASLKDDLKRTLNDDNLSSKESSEIESKINKQAMTLGYRDRVKFSDYLSELRKEAKEAAKKLKKENKELRVLSTKDALTGLFNLRGMEEQIHNELALVKREKGGHFLAVFIIDIDGFKAVNDILGHRGGDKVLRSIAAGLRKAFSRAGDTLARHGGDEMYVGSWVSPKDPFDKFKTIKRIREVLAKESIQRNNTIIPIGASIGYSRSDELPENMKGNIKESMKELVHRADKCMYVDKWGATGEKPKGYKAPEWEIKSGKMIGFNISTVPKVVRLNETAKSISTLEQ